jgi:hypothetical protein
MKILKWSLLVIALIVLLIAGFLAYLGFFSPLKVYETKLGPFTIAYESFTGPYAKSGAVFSLVYSVVRAAGIEPTRGLGIYYDDPGKVAADKLRSDCGVVIEAKDFGKLKVLRKKLKVKRIDQDLGLVVEFPIRNSLSYMIGPLKAYPALMKYAAARGYRGEMTYELYDEPHKKIFFVLVIGQPIP